MARWSHIEEAHDKSGQSTINRLSMAKTAIRAILDSFNIESSSIILINREQRYYFRGNCSRVTGRARKTGQGA